jgi:hypothetical protein
MSYTSSNNLGPKATLAQVRELVLLLGFRRVDDGLKVPGRTDCYFWADRADYRSFVGVGLDIYRRRNGRIVVETRTRAGRSYWDLVHQNKTIKHLRDFFGGPFRTDEGRGRYLRPEGRPPAPVASGCFVARWRFHNALARIEIYQGNRELKGEIARETPTGLPFVDELNPRLFSNNLIIPYAVAIWEDFFKSSFVALLRYSRNREAAFKRARLSHTQLEVIAAGEQSVEEAFAAFLSFQRPSGIADNFRLLDPKLDLAGALRKPYRRRRVSLFSSIESLVDDRNAFVHAGTMNTDLTDIKLASIVGDLVVGVDRAYALFGAYAGFELNRDY